jgi:methionyl-tRNA synthetase
MRQVCTRQPTLRESEHIFLDLSRLQPRVEQYLEKQWARADCRWSTNAIAITRAWLKKGLEERCITRDLKWGTPVPLKQFDKKVRVIGKQWAH